LSARCQKKLKTHRTNHIPWILDLTLSMVSLDSTSSVIVLPVLHVISSNLKGRREGVDLQGLDEDLLKIS
jgi:hypothetical protein